MKVRPKLCKSAKYMKIAKNMKRAKPKWGQNFEKGPKLWKSQTMRKSQNYDKRPTWKLGQSYEKEPKTLKEPKTWRAKMRSKPWKRAKTKRDRKPNRFPFLSLTQTILATPLGRARLPLAVAPAYIHHTLLRCNCSTLPHTVSTWLC